MPQPSPATDPAIPSPCTGVCRLNDAADQCVGCLRTVDEIAAWPALSQQRKRALLRDLATRGLPR